MRIHLDELKEKERIYLKREFYDKLDAIKEKIALRAIKKLLEPYIVMKFRSKKNSKSWFES